MYTIVLSPLAVKRYKKIGAKDRPKIDRKLAILMNDPLSGKALEGEYKGRYSLRVWPLRIIYRFNRDEKTITIITLDYRGNVYKN